MKCYLPVQIKERRFNMAGEFNSVEKFYKSSDGKFETKRQASKYLNHYGSVWKKEHNIVLSAPKRGGKDA
jgi:hypothetical protein